VSTGFAEPKTQTEPLTGKSPLKKRGSYVYWVEVAEQPIAGSIETEHVEIVPQETLDDGAEFKVALFAFPDELVISDSHSVGTFRYRRDGRFVVWQQPGGKPTKGTLDAPDAEFRMFFPVGTPNKAGRNRLRCNIYFRGVLVQSRVVTAHVGVAPTRGRAQTAKVDFQLARLESASNLAPIQPHALSLQLNTNGATHSFRFASFVDGEKEIKRDAVLSAADLQDLITQARRSMRKAAWGTMDPWKEGSKFRYTAKPYPDLKEDLLDMWRKGRQLYDAIINELAGGPIEAGKLRKNMRKPGRVQVVNSGPASELIPTSLVYDYRNAIPAHGDPKLCPEFLAATKEDKSLEEAVCFKDECPSREEPQVVCPSGFWGYRHAIGIPVRSKYDDQDLPLNIKFSGSPSLGIAVFPEFSLFKGHRGKIAGAVPGWTLLEDSDTFDEALAMLKTRPHVAYFYCHGGVTTGNTPYLLVGNDKKQIITPVELRPSDDDLEDLYHLPRSLIILNGCETNAVEPNRAMKLVTAFVENVAATGVIGTEITVSEELASAFGEALLKNLRASVEVGEAIRRARLALLKEGNPLGLVYLPLAPSDMKFVEGPVN
jgi:hypothetical protein